MELWDNFFIEFSKFLDFDFTLRIRKLSKVYAEIREMLLGHKIGLASCYYRPSVEEMYGEYEKAIDNLTIDPSKRLQRKVETLTIEKSRRDK